MAVSLLGTTGCGGGDKEAETSADTASEDSGGEGARKLFT